MNLIAANSLLAAFMISGGQATELTSTLFNSSSLLVLNKTTVANTAGYFLVSAFLMGSLIYAQEEAAASAKAGGSHQPINLVDQILGARQQHCDCEVYCTNKYYYGQYGGGGEEYSSYYTKR